MDYVEAKDARNMDGMRLALTVGVCGPWSEAAKYILQVKDIPFVPVAQHGGQENPDLVDWTGHGNAPVTIFEDEPPRAGWAEILMQAERLAPEPALPGSADDTLRLFSDLLVSEDADPEASVRTAILNQYEAIMDSPSPLTDPHVVSIAGALTFVLQNDDDVNVRDWKDVIWAMTTRMDPARDTTIIDNTPIDYLDFASPVSGLGSKIGLDATNKLPGETNREWGKPIVMDEKVKQKIDDLWDELGIFD